MEEAAPEDGTTLETIEENPVEEAPTSDTSYDDVDVAEGEEAAPETAEEVLDEAVDEAVDEALAEEVSHNNPIMLEELSEA